MKLKIDENGGVVLQDGKPVYVYDDGKEIPFDAPAAMAKISSLNAEAKDHRLRAKELAEQLKGFEGITDPVEALKAMETVKNFDAKKMIDAGEVETLKRQMAETFDLNKKSLLDSFETSRKQLESQLQEKDSTIYQLMVSSQFSKSPLFTGENPKTILPPDMAAEYFGKNFKVEEGKVVGYLNGEKIPSRIKFGEPADFEEALAVIVNAYPMKDRIMRAGVGGGPDSKGNTGNNLTNSKTIKKDDMNAFMGNIEGIAKGEIKVV